MTARAGAASVAALLAGAVVVGLTAAATRVPWQATSAESALLRLSWRTPALVLRNCDAARSSPTGPTSGAVVGAQFCSGEGVAWALDVRVDGADVVQDTIHSAGVRGDRPIYVLRTVPMTPGSHRIEVSFRPIFPADAAVPDSVRDRALGLQAAIDLADRDVLLVTVEQDQDRLVARTPIGPG